MNSRFFLLLIIGIFLVVVTMQVHHSNANTGDMHSYAGCAPGVASGGFNVSFKTGGHNLGDHVSGKGQIYLKCGQVDVTYRNLKVTATVVKKWFLFIPYLTKEYVTQDRILRCSLGPTNANVTGTATAGNPKDTTASDCSSK